MASNVVNLYLVELDCFIALLSALLSLWWSSILLNLLFVSWFVLLKLVLFFLHLMLVSFVPWFVLSKFVLLFWYDFKNGAFVLQGLIYGLRFLIIVDVWSHGAVLLIGLWVLFAWKILLNFICALCWVLLIKEVYFLIEMKAPRCTL